MPVASKLLGAERSDRLDAAACVDLDPDGIYALRGTLAFDDDGEVRGVAAERMGLTAVVRTGGVVAVAVRIALVDALDDSSPYVRERAAAALGRHLEPQAGSAGDVDVAPRPLAIARLAEATAVDSMWRVRRAAVRALAGTQSEAVLPLLCDALDDPFWRVRYAAIQALAPRPGCEALVAARVAAPASARKQAALAYLGSLLRGDRSLPVAPAEPEREHGVDAVLADEDPAVVAARLARTADADVRAGDLVAMLTSPHDVLRRLAQKRIETRARPDELEAALGLLEERRTPYAAQTVHRLLARTDTCALRRAVLDGKGAAPGAVAWALEDATSRGEDVGALAGEQLSHPDVRVRRAAARAATGATPTAALVGGLSDVDDPVKVGCVGALASRLETDAGVLEAVLAIDPAHAPPPVARAIVAVFAGALGGALGLRARDVLARAVFSHDPSARSAAAASLAHAGLLSEGERSRFLADPDPWIRSSALDEAAALRALEADADPTVRRDAFQLLSRGRLPSVRAVSLAAACDDPWLRALAAAALGSHGEPEALLAILRLTRDRAPMVRAAAADALAARPDAGAACLALVLREPPADEELRLAAHGRLVQEGSPRAFQALVEDLAGREMSPRARDALLGMSLAYPDAVRAGSPFSFEPRPAREPAQDRSAAPARAAPAPPRRALGKTGLALSPLAISGAFELPLSCLERAREAGVNTFFWEPDYRAMSGFLAQAPRKEELVVIAGSYEADARTIERDVDRALRRLRVERLGVMLLFWVRSPARLSREAYDCLARLRERGKVGAIGLSTHRRDLATQAIVAGGWDVVMCRHSAAHPGVELSVLPAAREHGVGVITFSALVYGRMLMPGEGGVRMEAADCYRYSLVQPGVTSCLSAPRRQRELEENLKALQTSTLATEAVARLRAHGARVHDDNRAFVALVRQG